MLLTGYVRKPESRHLDAVNQDKEKDEEEREGKVEHE